MVYLRQYKKLLDGLAPEDVKMIKWEQLADLQHQWIRNYGLNSGFPHLQELIKT